MKRLLFAVLCLSLICFTGCAETPAEDIVVNKGDGTLEDKIENSEGTGLEMENDEQEYTETDTGYVFHETNSFTSSNGIVTYNIDADVYIPKDTAMPVLEITPKYWTAESIEEITRIFLGDADVYEYTSAMTKDEIMEVILEKRQRLSDREALLEYYGSEETVNFVVETLERELAAAERDYENAPDYIERVLSDFEFHNDTYWYTEYSTLNGIPDHTTVKAVSEVDDIPYFIWVTQNEREAYRFISYALWACSPTLPEMDLHRFANYCQTHPFTQDEIDSAVKRVEETLLELNAMDDLTDWKIDTYTEMSYPDNGIDYYYLRFSFTPVYHGHNGVALPVGVSFAPPAEELYSGESLEETMHLDVSNGKILYFSYNSPMTDSQVLNESVELLTYEEAMERIYTQLDLSITGNNLDIEPFTSYKVTSAKINIDKIELCLIRTPMKDTFDAYYMMPAWCVYGVYEMTEISNGEDTTFGFVTESNGTPIFVINAVDGSVISSSI